MTKYLFCVYLSFILKSRPLIIDTSANAIYIGKVCFSVFKDSANIINVSGVDRWLVTRWWLLHSLVLSRETTAGCLYNSPWPLDSAKTNCFVITRIYAKLCNFMVSWDVQVFNLPFLSFWNIIPLCFFLMIPCTSSLAVLVSLRQNSTCKGL